MSAQTQRTKESQQQQDASKQGEITFRLIDDLQTLGINVRKHLNSNPTTATQTHFPPSISPSTPLKPHFRSLNHSNLCLFATLGE